MFPVWFSALNSIQCTETVGLTTRRRPACKTPASFIAKGSASEQPEEETKDQSISTVSPGK